MSTRTRAIARDIAESEASTQAKNTGATRFSLPEKAELQTFTATVGITVYAKSRSEAYAILDDMSMHDDCQHFNVHDIECDEEEQDYCDGCEEPVDKCRCARVTS